MAKTISYSYTKNGQLEQVAQGANVEVINWPEENLIKNGDDWQIDSVNPVVSNGDQTIEVIEENGHVNAIENEQQEGVEFEKNSDRKLEKINYKKKEKVKEGFAYEYDDEGNLTKKTDMSQGKSETYEYEEGKKKSYTDMEGRKFFWKYDEAGNVVSEAMTTEENIITSHVYGEKGLKKSMTIEGTTINYSYDVYGNKTEDKIGTADHFITTKYERDAAGNKTAQMEGENERRKNFVYDVNNKIVEIEETRGKTKIDHSPTKELQTITDPLGRVTKLSVEDEKIFKGIEDPQGKKWETGYDDKKRISWKKRPDGQVIRYTYDPTGHHIREITTEGINQRKLSTNENLLYAQNDNSKCVFKYNESGKHIGYDVHQDGKDAIQIRCEVDATGIRKSLDIKTNQIIDQVLNDNNDLLNFIKEEQDFGGTINYAYDDRGRLTGIESGAFLLNLGYGENGGISRITGGNGMEINMEFTGFGYLNKAHTTSAGKTISNLELGYDTGGNVTSRKLDNENTSYAYDDDDQLIEVKSTSGNQKIAYDKVGNRLRIEGDDANAFEYDEHKMYLKSCEKWDYTYDANGFLSGKSSKSNPDEKHEFTYNSYGQLIGFKKLDGLEEVVSAKYKYDALGRRIEKKVDYLNEPEKSNYLYFVYDGDNLLLEHNADMSYWKKYIFLSQVDSMLGFIENGKPFYYLKDNQGCINKIISGAGEVVAAYTHDAFGKILGKEIKDGAPENRYHFSSREWDEESGTYFFRNRTYDPNTGRFLQPDPYPGDAERPITIFNKYIFAANNPLKFADPHGLCILTVLAAFGLMLALVAAIVLAVVAIVAAIALSLVAGLLIVMLISIPLALVMFTSAAVFGLVFGGILAMTSDMSFGEAFGAVFKGTIRAFGAIAGVLTGAVLGALGYIIGGTIGLFDGGNWRKGAEKGWDIGFNTGFFIGNLPGEAAIVAYETMFGDEVDFHYHPKLACFSIYCSRVAYVSGFDAIQAKLPKGVITSPELVFENNGTDTQGFIAHSSDFILVAFRGSETDPFSAYDWLVSDIGGNLTREDWYGIFGFEQIGKGWFDAYDSVRNHVLDSIRSLQVTKHRPVFVSGHSLGGALAATASLDITEQIGCEVYCYSCGAPKVGNEAWASRYNSKVFNSQLLQNPDDLVPEVPLGTYGYFHVDKEHVLSLGGGHGGGWYVNNVHIENNSPEGFDFLPDDEDIRDLILAPDTSQYDFPAIHNLEPKAPLKLI